MTGSDDEYRDCFYGGAHSRGPRGVLGKQPDAEGVVRQLLQLLPYRLTREAADKLVDRIVKRWPVPAGEGATEHCPWTRGPALHSTVRTFSFRYLNLASPPLERFGHYPHTRSPVPSSASYTEKPSSQIFCTDLYTPVLSPPTPPPPQPQSAC